MYRNGLIGDIPWVAISREHTNMTGSMHIGPLADLVANWAQHFLGPSLPLFGKLGPSKLGPWKMLVWQIGPLQIGPRQIGPPYNKYICIGYTANA